MFTRDCGVLTQGCDVLTYAPLPWGHSSREASGEAPLGVPEHLGDTGGGMLVLDDYAMHEVAHPSGLAAALQAALVDGGQQPDPDDTTWRVQ